MVDITNNRKLEGTYLRHIGTQPLETKRLILRKYKLADAEAMYRNWASDDEVTKFLTWPTHSSVEITRQILEAWVKEYINENTYHWAITMKENGDEPIGDIAVVSIKENAAVAHIGYCIGKAWWNQGITSEALGAISDFLFDIVG